jgi:hypothetical protein
MIELAPLAKAVEINMGAPPKNLEYYRSGLDFFRGQIASAGIGGFGPK